MIQIRCYNVMFILKCKNESEYYKIECFGKRLQHETIRMTDIFKWCNTAYTVSHVLYLQKGFSIKRKSLELVYIYQRKHRTIS